DALTGCLDCLVGLCDELEGLVASPVHPRRVIWVWDPLDALLGAESVQRDGVVAVSLRGVAHVVEMDPVHRVVRRQLTHDRGDVIAYLGKSRVEEGVPFTIDGARHPAVIFASPDPALVVQPTVG